MHANVHKSDCCQYCKYLFSILQDETKHRLCGITYFNTYPWHVGINALLHLESIRQSIYWTYSMCELILFSAISDTRHQQFNLYQQKYSLQSSHSPTYNHPTLTNHIYDQNFLYESIIHSHFLTSQQSKYDKNNLHKKLFYNLELHY